MDGIRSVAVIGLGKMGLPMAGHLLDRGFTVVGVDPSPEARAALVAHGGRIAEDPAEAAAASDLVLVVVGTDEQVTEVVAGPRGLVRSVGPGQGVLICSTVHPDVARHAAADLAAVGARTADATLCRAEHAAVDGTLLVLFAGDAALLEEVRPVLAAFATDVIRVGDVGDGQVAKMINNILLWMCVTANEEALSMARRLGLAQGPLIEALMLSSGANWALGTWSKARPMPWAEDDIRICLELGADHGITMPITAAAGERIAAIKRVKHAEVPGGPSASMFAYVETVGGAGTPTPPTLA